MDWICSLNFVSSSCGFLGGFVSSSVISMILMIPPRRSCVFCVAV